MLLRRSSSTIANLSVINVCSSPFSFCTVTVWTAPSPDGKISVTFTGVQSALAKMFDQRTLSLSSTLSPTARLKNLALPFASLSAECWAR